MAIEIERTFLAKYLPKDLSKHPYKDCLDIYIPSTNRHPNLRLRQLGNSYEITKKQIISDASHQMESTIPLSKEEFVELSKVPGKRIQKKRYYYPYGNNKAEIDIFSGDLKGLVLIDFEFTSSYDASEFTPPDFCLIDITEEEFIAGGYLAGKKLSDIISKLSAFQYKVL